MDSERRDLERLLARSPGDESLRQRVVAARARAGLPGVRETVAAATDLARELRAARAAYASGMAAAFRRFLAGAFLENPALEHLIFEWQTDQPADREWIVRSRAVVAPALGPPAGYLDPAVHGALASGLLAFARVLIWSGELEERQSFRRAPTGVSLRVHEGPFDFHLAGAPDSEDLEALRSEPELRRLALEELGLREVTFHEVEVLQPSEDTRVRHFWLDANATLPFADGDTRAALAVAAEAEATLAARTARLVAAGRLLFEQLVPALFLETPRLDLVAVHAYTPGYNDNWYCEHRQNVSVTREQLGYLLEDMRRRGLDERGIRAPTADLAAEERAVEAALAPFEPFLRELHGSCWLLVLRRTAAGPEVTVGPGWQEL